MTEKPKTILVFLHCYLPGFKLGGPVASMQGMTQHLGDNFEFHIVTMDRDIGDTNPYPDVKKGEWNDVENAKVLYVESMSDPAIKKQVFSRQWDLVYVQSYFNVPFSLLPLYWWKRGKIKATEALVAPRGEFSKGAITLKPLKKKLYRFVLNRLGFFKKVSWHLSTELEKKEFMREIGLNVASDKMFVARNLAPIRTGPDPSGRVERNSDKLKLVFLSRISPKKNLGYALDLMRNLSDMEVELNIFGPVDENDPQYWELCQKKITSLPSNITVHYRGPIERREALEVFANHDLFLFPTRGENFGHVIFESLLAGCPVICSDQTPWSDMEEHGVGKTIDLAKPDDFIKALLDFSKLTAEESSSQRKRCQEYAANVFVKDGTVKANYEMFERLTKENRRL